MAAPWADVSFAAPGAAAALLPLLRLPLPLRMSLAPSRGRSL